MIQTPAPAGLALPVTDRALADRLQQRMQVVEEALAGHVVSRTRYVTEAASHLLAAGGADQNIGLVYCSTEGPAGGGPPGGCAIETTEILGLSTPPGL